MDLPETRESLLVRVRDPEDRDAWDQFVSIYRPVVYRMARKRGLQDVDAQDLTQRVLIAVSKSIASWKPQGGAKFRHWLARVAKNKALNLLTRQPKDLGQGGSELPDSLAQLASPEIEQSYDTEYQRQLYRRAAQIVQHRADETTWLAFSLTMIDGLSVEATAERLQIRAGSVYAARSRIIRRLKVQVENLQSTSEELATSTDGSSPNTGEIS